MHQNFNLKAADRKDVYTRITDAIIAQLELGTRPWMKPWDSGVAPTRPLRHNGLPYAGINVIMLWAASAEKGYDSPFWMTFRQAKALGAHVRKQEHGSLVVYADTVTRTEHNEETGEDDERTIPFLKGYTVFHASQIEGLPERYYARPPPKRDRDLRLVHADLYIAHTRVSIRYGGNRAYYSPDKDHIRMPPPDAFPSAESFYATLLHEVTHWSGHSSRLARDFGRKAWGDAGYAQEELVAELASAFLCADLEITPELRDDHAAYISSWVKVLNDDNRAIFRASAHAQRAVDYLHRLQPDHEAACTPDAPEPSMP